MIMYQGTIYKNHLSYLVFCNEKGIFVEIPVDNVIADRVSKYLSKIVESGKEILIRENDEDSD